MRGRTTGFSYSFFDKYSIIDKLQNSNDLVIKNKETGQFLLLKQIDIIAQEYEQTLATFQYQKKLQHQQLLSVIDYYPQINRQKIIVLYQYCCISLKDQFYNRKIENREFEQTQLWSIFTSLTFGLAYLQNMNVGHGSVSLLDCFLNQDGFVKVSDPTCATSNPYTVIYGYFYSPQILRCLVNSTKEQINIFKSDVFALGCCMLQLTLMKQVQTLFNYGKGVINKVNLLCLLNELDSLQLSKQYIRFINEMLLLNQNQRPDFIKLQQQIFNILSLDKNQCHSPKSSHIPSSISSLFQQKNMLKSSLKQDNKLVIHQMLVSQKKYPIQSKNVSFSDQQYKLNRGKKIFQNNMKQFFNNLPEIDGKYQSDQYSQISQASSSELQLQSNNNKYLQFNQKRKRKRLKLNKTTNSIQKDYNNSQNQQKILLQLNKTHFNEVQVKKFIKPKDLTSSSIYNKQNSFSSKTSSQSQIKSLTHNIESQVYTNPDFLKMMQANVMEILVKRNLGA